MDCAKEMLLCYGNFIPPPERKQGDEPHDHLRAFPGSDKIVKAAPTSAIQPVTEAMDHLSN